MENQQTSFRGNAIPEIKVDKGYKLSDDKQVIEKFTKMSEEQRNAVSIDAVHYADSAIAEVKLSTGDVIPVETAIALTDNHLISGYSTGNTYYGKKTLRSKPSTSKEAKTRIRDLPRF